MIPQCAELEWAAAATQPAVAACRDLDLELCRRLDWRYLLPNTQLGDVAYLGPGRGQLLKALERFASTVTVLPANQRELLRQGKNFDLVVVESLCPSDVERACEDLKRGGFLYWEAGGRRGRKHGRQLGRWLAGLGMGQVQVHWHRPDFEMCREMIPMGEPGAMAFVAGRGKQIPARPAVTFTASALSRSGMIERTVRCRSVIARKGSSDDSQPQGLVKSFLRSKELSRSPKLASIVATPRFRASRHVIHFFLEPGKSQPALVAKVPRLRGETASLDREAENLRAIHALRRDLESVPRVLDYGEFRGERILVETGLAGRTMGPAAVRGRPRERTAKVVDWLIQLHLFSAKEEHERDWFERLVEEPLQAFAEAFPLTEEERMLLARTRQLVSPIREERLPLVFEHGDLSAPNILEATSGGVGVVDWELADPRGLPAVDLFFFLTYVAFAMEDAQKSGQYVEAFRRAFFGRSAWAKPYIEQYAGKLGLSLEVMTRMFVACWGRYVANLLLRLNDLGAGPRATPVEETVEWLRGNRYFALWRYAVEHFTELGFAPMGSPQVVAFGRRRIGVK